MSRAILLLPVLFTGCAVQGDAPAPSLDGVLVHDPGCARESGEDCMRWLEPGGSLDVAGVTELGLELRIHSDGPDLGEVEDFLLIVDGAPVAATAIDLDINPAGSDVTLLVPALPPGAAAIEAHASGAPVATFEFFATDGILPAYGSTYSSSCTCSYCSLWCSTKSGTVQYSGTCC